MSWLAPVADWLKAALLYGGGWPLALLLLANAFGLSMICQRLGASICLYRVLKTVPANWAEKARLIHPLWVFLGLAPAIVGLLVLIFTDIFEAQMSFVGSQSLSWLCLVACVLGAGWVSVKIESSLKERLISMSDLVRHLMVVLLLFFPHFFILFWISISAPDRFLPGVWLLAIGFYVLNGGLLVARWIGLARPPSEELKRIVETTAQRMGVWPRATYIIRWKAANAIAFPNTKRIAFTDTLLNHLNEHELIPICAHELAHLTEPGRIRLLRIAGTFIWLPFVCIAPIVGTFGHPALLLTFACIFIGHMAVRRLSRAMEKRADSISQLHEREAGRYAQALEHLYRLNLTPAVMRRRNLTHPDLYDRLLAAQITPSYPRPGPPSRWRTYIALLTTLVFALIYFAIFGAALTMILT